MRFRARLAAARGDDVTLEARFKNAVGMLVELDVPFWAAVVRLEHAEWLAERGRIYEAEPLLEAPIPEFEHLRVDPMTARARNISSEPVEAP